MIRKNVLLLSSIFLMIFAGCVNDPQMTLKKKIISKIFSGAQLIALVKENIPDIYDSVIIGDELEKFIGTLEDIGDIREYEISVNNPKESKSGFHVMFVYKGSAKIPVLYSISQSALVVRKYDIIPSDKVKSLNIDVYEFSITEEAVKILGRYENMLPQKGYFYDILPPP